MTADEKPAKRCIGQDTEAMIKQCTRTTINAVSESRKGADDVQVVAFCARELDWLASKVALHRKAPRRASDQDREGGDADVDIWVADALSVLTLIRTQRYYLAAEASTSGNRDVYPVAAQRAVRVPYELRFRDVKAAWSNRAPPMSARSSAPSRSARRSRTRSARR
jgi:hypothetical protein